MRICVSFVFCILMIISACSIFKPGISDKKEKYHPAAEREFRAAWIASVANINWPSEPGLSTARQKEEAVFLLDLLRDHNFNAAVFQVRPQCDALYKSELEPWSYYLTGEQGKAPEPWYDPLDFWIEEAHKRGLELHVWLNPYRAHHINGGEVTQHSIVKRHPELVLELSSGYWWLDPALPATRDHSSSVVMDIVKRYDIDGVHMDDYFYPYPSYHDGDFPDDKSWESYQTSGGELSRGNWRRESVNKFIERLYREIKQEKPYVKFGLSPFGIWRPNNPESIQGFDQYDQLYADARLWLNEGWIDYWTPQLYWPINQIPQSFPVLLGWWARENLKSRHLWPGMNISKGNNDQGVDEVINEIMVTRGMLPNSPGNVHWSIGGLDPELPLVNAISRGPYKKQALVPASLWLDDEPPTSPDLSIEVIADSVVLNWNHEDIHDVFLWVVYLKYGNSWNYKILPRMVDSLKIPAFNINVDQLQKEISNEIDNAKNVLMPINQIFVTAVDRTGNESIPVQLSVTEISYEYAPLMDEIRSMYDERE